MVESAEAQGTSWTTGMAVGCMGLMILSTLLLGGLACNPDRTEAVRLYNEGMQQYQGGNSGQAAALMEQALEVDPTFSDAAYTLGQIYQQRLSDPDSARHAYRRALDHAPEEPRFAYRLGSAYADMEDHDGAIEYLGEAVALDPQYSRAWFDKGMSQESIGENLDAIESYTRAIETNPRLRMDADDIGGEHYHALADLYLRFRLYDHAVRVYENGVRNNPESARLYHGLGVAQMRMERFHEAVDSFEKALEIEPNHGSANFNIAVAYHEGGNTDAAIEQLTRLTEGGAGMTEARHQAVEALLHRLDRDEEE